MMKRILLVCGARPNFMKIAPLWREMNKYPDEFIPVILHTGQHYDKNMSDLFFRDLELPEPDVYLGVGSASHAAQTAKIMIAFEKYIMEKKTDIIVVVGDVNSTLACSVVSSKLLIPVAHVEAGLRSFDRTMPEEINRVVTDHLSDYLFTTCEDADKNLKNEGISEQKIYFVGNVMIDTLMRLKVKSEKSDIRKTLGLKERSYAVLTLHRPSNVDELPVLKNLFSAFENIGKHIPIVFPAHPRTVKQMESFGLRLNEKNLKLVEPLGYLDFIKLCSNARFVMTDSGGVQEETTYLGIPCLTIRENTERPVTVREGTNILVGTDGDKLVGESLNVLNSGRSSGEIPKFWDGNAARRIVKILQKSI